MEDVPPPPPDHRPDTPTPGVASTTQPNDDHPAPAEPTHDIFPTFDLAVTIAAVPPISAVATYWYNSCAGGDVQSNNCAHYLSDAFIRAGYAELASANPHVNARCATPARRPIRARDMWSWFQSKARVTRRTLPGRNTGWWAIFQLDESAYWGGHVVVLDSNAWVYYGTGWYGAWAQYAYQW
ncbi:hypothetical protein BJY04DRAFT_228281 [Aspergillus karnatakaensis]|uniref:uncharacterized protein n=1 Tax=Aspergillus karnatakaensis TaxID=1810916 RepID=UPI003CCD54A5